jgi:hypothetical protein
MRRVILGTAIALLGAGCISPPSGDGSDLSEASIDAISIEASPTPFSHITAGEVQAIVPDGWHARPAGPTGDARAGFLASPRPDAYRRMDGSTVGMSATWVDATQVGVPSDFYYLAATGPLLSHLTHSDTCRAETRQVYLDNRPSFDGSRFVTGDYMALGEGTCGAHDGATRWAYFVAAPGFGPVRTVGIPASGLYVVVAVMRESERARAMLHRLIEHTSFGGASIPEIMAAGRIRAS